MIGAAEVEAMMAEYAEAHPASSAERGPATPPPAWPVLADRPMPAAASSEPLRRLWFWNPFDPDQAR